MDCLGAVGDDPQLPACTNIGKGIRENLLQRLFPRIIRCHHGKVCIFADRPVSSTDVCFGRVCPDSQRPPAVCPCSPFGWCAALAQAVRRMGVVAQHGDAAAADTHLCSARTPWQLHTASTLSANGSPCCTASPPLPSDFPPKIPPQRQFCLTALPLKAQGRFTPVAEQLNLLCPQHRLLLPAKGQQRHLFALQILKQTFWAYGSSMRSSARSHCSNSIAFD